LEKGDEGGFYDDSFDQLTHETILFIRQIVTK